MCDIRQDKNGQLERNKFFLSIHQFFPTIHTFIGLHWPFYQFRLKGKNFSYFLFTPTNMHQKHFSNTAVHLGSIKGSASHTHKQSFLCFEKASVPPDFQTVQISWSMSIAVQICGEKSVWLSFKCSEASLMYRADRRAARRTCGLKMHTSHAGMVVSTICMGCPKHFSPSISHPRKNVSEQKILTHS